MSQPPSGEHYQNVENSQGVIQTGYVGRDLSIEQKIQIADESHARVLRYLQGRLNIFAKEEALFVGLAGERLEDTLIQTRFAGYAAEFGLDESPMPGPDGAPLPRFARPLDRFTPEAQFEDIIEAVAKYPRFVLVGDPGAGKSTTLRQLFKAEARAYLDAPPHTQPLPLWINLGDSRNPLGGADLLDFWWFEHALPETAGAYFNNDLLHLYLDGLNEMPEGRAGGDRAKRAAALRDLLAAHPDIPVIVTCRIRDYDEALHLGLPVVRIHPLDDERAQQFIRKRTGGSLDLWEAVQGKDALQRMVRNPYNLKMLIELYGVAGRLPDDLNALYRLWSETRYKEYADRGLVRLPWRTLEKRLGRLAYRMIERGKGTVAESDWVRRQLGKHALSDAIGLGLLVEEGDNVRFYHQSLHVYFAFPLLSRALQRRWYDDFVRGLMLRARPILVRLGLLSKFDFFKQFRKKPVDDFYDRATNRKSFLVEKVGDLGEAAVPILTEALESNDINLRLASLTGLAQLGEEAAPAVPELSKALRDEDVYVRLRAVDALGAIGDPTAIAVLTKAAVDDSQLTREAALALGKIGEAAVPSLIMLLGNDDTDVRDWAAQALARIGEAAVPALSEALELGNDHARFWAAMALGFIGDRASSASSVLINALGHENSGSAIHFAIHTALGRINSASVPTLIEALRDDRKFIRSLAIDVLGDIGEAALAAVPELIETLRDEDEEVRKSAANALGKVGEAATPAVPALIEALRDEDRNVRFSAAEVLGEIGEAAAPAVPALIETLRDENWLVRIAAALAAHRLGEPAANILPTLIEALRDEDENVRWRAASALVYIGEAAAPAVPALIEVLRDENVRYNAAEALRKIGTPEALAAVEEYERQQRR